MQIFRLVIRGVHPDDDATHDYKKYEAAEAKYKETVARIKGGFLIAATLYDVSNGAASELATYKALAGLKTVVAETARKSVLGSSENAIRNHLYRAIEAWPQFDKDKPVNGADLVEWFCEWREDAKRLLKGESK